MAAQGVLEGTALFREGEDGAREEEGAYGGREEGSVRRHDCGIRSDVKEVSKSRGRRGYARLFI